MSSDREVVARHVKALLAEAAEQKIPRDVVGRLLVQEAIEIWKLERSISDIESELKFVVESLDPDTDFEFMRP
ncbi:MAG: hypothetical protein JRG94_10920 [Deltaproteobacteria bacterium]|nr:hypothetical protein [Deltaproteobacteria bacterium]